MFAARLCNSMLLPCVLMAASDTTTRPSSLPLGQSQPTLCPPSTSFVLLMCPECKHRRIHGLVLSSVLILHCGSASRPCQGLAWLVRTRDWSTPDGTCSSLVNYKSSLYCSNRLRSEDSSPRSTQSKALPSRGADHSRRLAGGTAGPDQHDGNFCGRFNLGVQAAWCSSPQNFKDVFDAMAEDKCENQPKKENKCTFMHENCSWDRLSSQPLCQSCAEKLNSVLSMVNWCFKSPIKQFLYLPQ